MNAQSPGGAEGPTVPVDKTGPTDDERIRELRILPPPEQLVRRFPIRGTPVEMLIAKTRRSIRRIISGEDDRLLVIMGPCSIHDPGAAMEYAQRLRAQRANFRRGIGLKVRGQMSRVESPEHPIHEFGQVPVGERRRGNAGNPREIFAPTTHLQKLRDGSRESGRRGRGSAPVGAMATLAVEGPMLPRALRIGNAHRCRQVIGARVRGARYKPYAAT